jgi:uncharacterized protein (TIGR01370 family)
MVGKYYVLILGGIFMLSVSCAESRKLRGTFEFKGIKNWVCIYNENASVASVNKFDLAILDADAHPDLAELKKLNTILIGYVSLGEVGEYRWYWNLIADKPWILGKNPNWDSNMIDVRAPEWQALVINEIIPKIIDKGFDGIFLDTIDNAEYLEKYRSKKKYYGVQAAMINLIKAIRKKFPSLYIIVNRGFSILNDIGSVIDGVVAESIFTNLDFKNNTVRLLTPNEYYVNIKKLLEVRQRFNLTVFTLDYTDPNDTVHVSSVIAKARKFEFIPYISTAKLDSIYFYTLD